MADPPTPRGYKKVRMQGFNDAGDKTQLIALSCEKCGALTVFHRTHTDWHKKEGR